MATTPRTRTTTSRNHGRLAVPAHAVATVMSTVTERLARRHEHIEPAVVETAVLQAASELVTTVTDPDELALLIERRVHARLMAMSGMPVAISGARARH